jgi:hypothetical protein
MAFFVRFSTRGVKKRHKKTFWGKPMSKILAEKVKNFFPLSFPFDFFLIVFLAVSLHEEPKNTTKTFSKT